MSDELRERILRYIDRRRGEWVLQSKILELSVEHMKAKKKEVLDRIRWLLENRLIEARGKDPEAYISRVAQRQQEWFDSL